MTPLTLVSRSLRHFWRTNLAVALGVGVAVSALAGALVVGDSVRASLRDLALARLGQTDHLVTASGLFTEQLADRLAAAPGFAPEWTGAVPVLALEGVVVHESSGRRAGRVRVFGVDDRFWQFHGAAGVSGPTGREALLSEALASELGVAVDDGLLLRIQKPTAIPAGVLQGRRDDPGRAVRLTTARVLSRAEAGEFSPQPQQGEARTLFVPLSRLQTDIEMPDRANILLVGRNVPNGETQALASLVDAEVGLADLSVRVRPVSGPALSIESDAGYLTDEVARGAQAAALDAGVEAMPVLTYLATAIKANGRETPYSLVSALPQAVIETAAAGPGGHRGATAIGPPPNNDAQAAPIWLSQWTADDLEAHAGDAVTLDYFLWSDADGLSSASAPFVVAGVLPMSGLAVNPDLAPAYPGLSTTEDISDWDPPFPVDLNRVRDKDEAYWDTYRTAAKAFIRVEDGQALWESPYGSLTSLRVPVGTGPAAGLSATLDAALRAHIRPSAGGFRVVPVRADALTAASGVTDFGEYFTYFSFFVVVASLLLTLLFFRLGVEQRAAEIGLLGALGYTPRTVARLLLTEGIVLAAVGAIVGTVGALGYSALIMLALRTLWIGAVGTTELQVHASAIPLAAGALGGLLAAVVFVLGSLRVLWRAPARRLMSGGWLDVESSSIGGQARVRLATWGSAAIAVVLVGATAAGAVPETVGFFGSGTLLLMSGLSGLALWLRSTSDRTFTAGRWPLIRFGVRNARYRPARSVLSTALIAAATFLIVSVGAFRQGADDTDSKQSSSGGYALIAESVAPLMHDPATAAGRDALSLGPEVAEIEVARFRLRQGDDASCLNLYRPQNPRLIGATADFIAENRFNFSASLAENDAEARNPWLLLDQPVEENVVPVIGDATSLAYVFHLGVGEEFVMGGPDGQPLRLRIVGALHDSVLQSELVMSEAHFARLFPRNEGYRLFLIEAPSGQTTAVADVLEQQLQDFGFDVQSTGERLAAYHRVENTYLNTFQALGALGLVLGTLGLGTVLLRNVLERRRELALLRATGYTRGHLIVTVLSESVFLLTCGLLLGAACAFVAIAPPLVERGDALPVANTLMLLAGVFASGLLSTVLATRAIATAELLPALKNE